MTEVTLQKCAEFVKTTDIYRELESQGEFMSASSIILHSADSLLMRALCYLFVVRVERAESGGVLYNKIMQEKCGDVCDFTAGGLRSAEIDKLLAGASYQPYELENKYYFINLTDSNDVVQNKLLKTLEQPPSKTSFIIIVNSLSSLLPTIISRCERAEVRLGICELDRMQLPMTNYYPYAMYASRGNLTEMQSMLSGMGVPQLQAAINVVSLMSSHKNMVKMLPLLMLSGDGVRQKFKKLLGYIEQIYDDILKWHMGIKVETYGAVDINRLSQIIAVNGIAGALSSIRVAVKRADNGNMLSIVDELIIKLMEVNYNAQGSGNKI